MTYATIIARHRPAAFGGVGINANQEAAHVASHYLYFRKVRGMGASKALEAAKELPATYVKGKGYYGPKGGFGAVMERHGDKLRWTESTPDAGLRFVGWSDELTRLGHNGWFTYPDGEPGDTLRGGVWQLPGRNGEALLIPGYAEFDGRDETNEGSACLCFSAIIRQPMRDVYGNLDETDGARDAARYADGIAESMAEDERDYREVYARGEHAAELDAELIAARREALPLLAEFRAARRGRVMLPEVVCELLQSRIRALLATVDEKREALRNVWSDCPSCDEEAWKAGFMDMSEGGFVRAVRLGFAKRSDWKGPADANPLDLAA